MHYLYIILSFKMPVYMGIVNSPHCMEHKGTSAHYPAGHHLTMTLADLVEIITFNTYSCAPNSILWDRPRWLLQNVKALCNNVLFV